MRHTKQGSLITVFGGIALLIFSVINITSCNPKDDQKITNTTTPTEKTEDQPPECPPVEIKEFYKLELKRAAVEQLTAAATNGGAFVFQFAYTKTATKRLSLIAYAAKPGRDFQPPTARRLEPLDVIALSLPDTISLGDQYVKIVAPKGLKQLIDGSGHAADYYSLTFTPQLSPKNVEISPGVVVVVTNIRYKVCVKIETSPGVFTETCGASEVELQPSPPAN